MQETMQPDVAAPEALLIPPPSPSNIADGDSEVPLSQLWSEFQAERMVQINDYFDEMQSRIESSEYISSTVLPPLKDELGLEDVDEVDLVPPNFEAMHENYGIDVDGLRFP